MSGAGAEGTCLPTRETEEVVVSFCPLCFNKGHVKWQLAYTNCIWLGKYVEPPFLQKKWLISFLKTYNTVIIVTDGKQRNTSIMIAMFSELSLNFSKKILSTWILCTSKCLRVACKLVVISIVRKLGRTVLMGKNYCYQRFYLWKV